MPPLTATVTERACAVVILDEAGVTVTDGVASEGVVVEVPAEEALPPQPCNMQSR